MAIHRHWQALYRSRGMLPCRSQFDPLAVPRLLPWIWLLDVQHAPLRFRFRLLGTEQVRLWASDPTGQWMDEKFPHLAQDAPTYAYLVKAAEEGVVCYNRGFPVVHVPKDYVLTERILLPLAQDGRQVDVVLGLSVYHFDEITSVAAH